MLGDERGMLFCDFKNTTTSPVIYIRIHIHIKSLILQFSRLDLMVHILPDISFDTIHIHFNIKCAIYSVLELKKKSVIYYVYMFD